MYARNQYISKKDLPLDIIHHHPSSSSSIVAVVVVVVVVVIPVFAVVDVVVTANCERKQYNIKATVWCYMELLYSGSYYFRCCVFVTCKYEINKRKFIYSGCWQLKVNTYLVCLLGEQETLRHNHCAVCMNGIAQNVASEHSKRIIYAKWIISRRNSRAFCSITFASSHIKFISVQWPKHWSTKDFACGQIHRKLFGSHFPNAR